MPIFSGSSSAFLKKQLKECTEGLQKTRDDAKTAIGISGTYRDETAVLNNLRTIMKGSCEALTEKKLKEKEKENGTFAEIYRVRSEFNTLARAAIGLSSPGSSSSPLQLAQALHKRANNHMTQLLYQILTRDVFPQNTTDPLRCTLLGDLYRQLVALDDPDSSSVLRDDGAHALIREAVDLLSGKKQIESSNDKLRELNEKFSSLVTKKNDSPKRGDASNAPVVTVDPYESKPVSPPEPFNPEDGSPKKPPAYSESCVPGYYYPPTNYAQGYPVGGYYHPYSGFAPSGGCAPVPGQPFGGTATLQTLPAPTQSTLPPHGSEGLENLQKILAKVKADTPNPKATNSLMMRYLVSEFASSDPRYLQQRSGGFYIRLLKEGYEATLLNIGARSGTEGIDQKRLCSHFKPLEAFPVLARNASVADSGDLSSNRIADFLHESLIEDRDSGRTPPMVEFIMELITDRLNSCRGSTSFGTTDVARRLEQAGHSSAAVVVLPPVPNENASHYTIIQAAPPATAQQNDIHVAVALQTGQGKSGESLYSPLGSRVVILRGDLTSSDSDAAPLVGGYQTFTCIPKDTIDLLSSTVMNPQLFTPSTAKAGQDAYRSLSSDHYVLCSLLLRSEQEPVPQPRSYNRIPKVAPSCYHRSQYCSDGGTTVTDGKEDDTETDSVDYGEQLLGRGVPRVVDSAEQLADKVSELTLQQSKNVRVKQSCFDGSLGSYDLVDARMTVVKILALPEFSHLQKLQESLGPTKSKYVVLATVARLLAERTMMHLKCALPFHLEEAPQLPMISKPQSEEPVTGSVARLIQFNSVFHPLQAPSAPAVEPIPATTAHHQPKP